MLSLGSPTRLSRHLTRLGPEQRSSLSTTDLATKPSQLHNSLPRRGSPSFLRKIRVFVRRETERLSFAREITFNGSTQMIFWLRIKSQSRWKRSEEHTSELQSLRHLVCRLLLEK